MKISVILAHPYDGSFNAAVAETVVNALQRKGHEVWFHHLYREQFNPIMPARELASDATDDALVRLHQEEIRQADGIVIVHPNWWGQPPAILTGWVERVLRENVAYAVPEGDNGGGLPLGLLKAKAALVFNTSNTPPERENEVFGDPLQRLWRDCIFAFCGVNVFDRLMFRVIADSSEAERKAWLQQAEALVEQYFA